MLQSVVSEGTGKRLGELNIALAGKTGTVGEADGNRDAWMAVYNGEYSACVWMGYDSAREGSLPPKATGGKYPALILYDLFSKLYADGAAPEFTMPDTVERVKLDGYTLKSEHRAVLANAFTPKDSTVGEVFLKGTAPEETTQYWAVPKAVRNVRVELNENNKPVITFSAAEQGMNYCIYTISGAERTMIASISGDGTLRYTDEAAHGGMASYAVAAEHPRLTVLGKKVQGPLSRTVSVIVPYSAAEQTNVPEVTLEDTEIDYDFDWKNAN